MTKPSLGEPLMTDGLSGVVQEPVQERRGWPMPAREQIPVDEQRMQEGGSDVSNYGRKR